MRLPSEYPSANLRSGLRLCREGIFPMNRHAQQGKAILPFLALILLAALFVWISSRSLPAVVASHFGISGHANRFMPRDAYVGLMLAAVMLVPLLLVALPTWAFRSPNAPINLPHRDYWLAPQRRAQTVATLSAQLVRFAILVLMFLCYVHWLVVKANQVTPPALASRWMVAGLAVFLLATLVWVVALVRRFGRVPG